jgi:aerobic-type carbon monoxide dehydrogenase small subunit (CoxS/CutS family)
LAIVLTFDVEARTENQEPQIDDLVLGPQFSVLPIVNARITLGCLAPTVIRADMAEAFLHGKVLDAPTCSEAGRLAAQHTRPIGDVRGSAEYRHLTTANLVAEGLRRIAAGRERHGWPERPVLLETAQEPRTENREPADQDAGSRFSVLGPELTTIDTTVNGRAYTLGGEAVTKSLLDALREDTGLTGTKEGCAEGECGACTVWLNGQAVMACLTPAGQAHGAAVTTIEGLAGSTSQAGRDANGSANARQREVDPQLAPPNSQPPALHPLQQAFIANAAVQCGYCIPGMLMAGAKLLEECPKPTLEQAQVALSGNICRCTGYRKILDAVMDAAGTFHHRGTEDPKN